MPEVFAGVDTYFHVSAFIRPVAGLLLFVAVLLNAEMNIRNGSSSLHTRNCMCFCEDVGVCACICNAKTILEDFSRLYILVQNRFSTP